jgi:hypothetical protein
MGSGHIFRLTTTTPTMAQGIDLDSLEQALGSLQRDLGATESAIATMGSILPLLSPHERQIAAVGVHLALELIRRERARPRNQGTIPR